MIFKTKLLIGSSYLIDREQLNLVSNIISDLLHEDVYGVPQGSVLGPLLFLLYVDGIKCVTENAYCHLYADDNSKRFTPKTASLERNIDHWLSININKK